MDSAELDKLHANVIELLKYNPVSIEVIAGDYAIKMSWERRADPGNITVSPHIEMAPVITTSVSIDVQIQQQIDQILEQMRREGCTDRKISSARRHLNELSGEFQKPNPSWANIKKKILWATKYLSDKIVASIIAMVMQYYYSGFTTS